MSNENPERVICAQNDAYPVSLTVNKTYRVLPDDDAAEHGFLRVIDDSGEDYLYPESHFRRPEPADEPGRASPATA